MKAVLASIRPRHCTDIANRQKALEVRKTCPKLETPFKVYIYCTAGKPYMVYNDDSWCPGYTVLNNWSEKRAEEVWELMNGKVIGEFVCDYIFSIDVQWMAHDELPGSPVETWLEWENAPEQYVTTEDIAKAACLAWSEIEGYIGGSDGVYCWHISELKIYDEPKPLSDFTPWCDCVIGYGECDHRKVGCSYQQADYNPDGSLNVVVCGKRMIRAPQSWCYVEEK